jgi:hypothetical protein
MPISRRKFLSALAVAPVAASIAPAIFEAEESVPLPVDVTMSVETMSASLLDQIGLIYGVTRQPASEAVVEWIEEDQKFRERILTAIMPP